MQDLLRAFGQLSDPRVTRVLAKAIAATVALLVALVAVAAAATHWLVSTGVGWLDPLLPWFSGVGALVVAVLLTPLAAISVLGLFVDEVAAAVEAVHYPDWPPARGVGIASGFLQAARLLGLAAILNLLALPFYLFLPAANLAIYLLLNGYLLGNEYFATVAQRREPGGALRQLRRGHRFGITVAGMVLASLALVPFVNLTVPVVGTAFMVHRYARAAGRRRGG